MQLNIAKEIERYFSPQVLRIFKNTAKLADECGYKIYIVGGTVRDIILGRNSGDIDIAVEGDAIRLGRVIVGRLLPGACFVSYKSFGTCSINIKKGLKLDLAMARKEIYKRPGAMPTVKPGSLEDDLKRRDFTINAMAVSINDKDFGRLFDPFSGMRDLKNGVIRVMHDASFIDDPTRILRALRFALRFAFRIEPGTKRLMKSALETKALETVSSGRIEKEILIMQKREGK